MQTILSTNNIKNTTNLNQGIALNDSTGIMETNEVESEVSFLGCLEEVMNQGANGIVNPNINLNDTELQINDIEQEEKNEEVTEIIIERIDIEEIDTDYSVNTTNSTNSENNMYIHGSLSVNSQSNEIGEKKLDSVKYSLGNNLSTSMDDLLKKDIFSSTNANRETLNDSEILEGVDIDEFSGEVDLFETSLDFNKISSNNQTENNMETNDIETNQKEIFKQIREGIRGNSTTRSMQILLKPHNLGKVNLNLKFFNNSMHINVFVENENVENLLRQNLEQIISTVNPTGAINIGSITVSKIEDLSKENSKEDNKYFDGCVKYKTNPFVHKIGKMNYYR